MKAVILAAGLGSRLRPITDTIPKCMVSVNGERIIDRQIHSLKENGISEIIVVSGYKGEVLRRHMTEHHPFVSVVDNREYDNTNNMYSLWLCRPYIKDEDFLLMNADVFFDANIITGLLKEGCENAIACDRSQYNEESMKISVREDGTIKHIGKTIPPDEAYAVSIDVYKLGISGSKALFSHVADFVENKRDRNAWTEVALDDCFPDVAFYPHDIKGRWMEIDDHKDLERSEVLFKSGR